MRPDELRRAVITHAIKFGQASLAGDHVTGQLHRTLSRSYLADLLSTRPAGRFCPGCESVRALGHKPGCVLGAA